MRIVVRKAPWVPRVGDLVKFTGEYAKGFRYPEGTIGEYAIKGHTGYVIARIGKNVVVRGAELESRAPPGRGYYDHWAPQDQLELLKAGTTGIEPPIVPSPGPYDPDRNLTLEEIFLAWADKRGIPRSEIPGADDVEAWLRGELRPGEKVSGAAEKGGEGA